MIPLTPVPEPADFDEKARKPGQEWLLANPTAERPRDFWGPFREALAEGVKHLCSYAAMFDPNGTMDHFLPFKTHPEQAYEWSNYRYATGWVNSSKKIRVALDPHEVKEGWFEIQIPSMHLVATDRIPPDIRARISAPNGLIDWLNGERFKRVRTTWYNQYLTKKMSLEALREYAPLIAKAIEAQHHKK